MRTAAEPSQRRVLVVTGHLCAGEIRRITEDYPVDVLELPLNVASLMTKNTLRHALKDTDLSLYDYIMVPGMVRENLDELEKDFHVRFLLGPVHFTDIPAAFDLSREQQLSRTIPADLLMKQGLRESLREMVKNADAIPDPLPPSTLVLGRGARRLPVGREFPPKVIAEIVSAPRMELSTILLKASEFARAGAKVIDVGMIPGEDHSDFIQMIVPLLHRQVGLCVSVDTMQRNEILAAADAGAELILSICKETLDIVPSIDTPFVLVPLETDTSTRPRSAEKKLSTLRSYAEMIEGAKMIVDPLLEPIGLGFSESVGAYLQLPQWFPNTPSLMGVGNVVELTDADSIGLNAILAALAAETGVGLLLTTENSSKTRGGTKELVDASTMMFYSNRKGIPPKNLGLDLLRYKEKSHRTEPFRAPALKVQAPQKTSEGEGEFRQSHQIFRVTIQGSRIHVLCRQKGVRIDIIGESGDAIAAELDKRGLLPEPQHAIYLGKELAKAEIGLKIGRSYIQDQPLFEVDFLEKDSNG